MINAKVYYPQAEDNDTIFIQGIIDLLVEEEAKAKYAMQIELYAQAASEIIRKPIKEKYLYLFHDASLIKM